jgi:predicted GNAT family acetyltransferase
MEVVRNDALGRFEIALPGGALAFADFEVRGGAVLFPHTVVPPAHEGQGLGSALVRASLDWARAEGLKVVLLLRPLHGAAPRGARPSRQLSHLARPCQQGGGCCLRTTCHRPVPLAIARAEPACMP